MFPRRIFMAIINVYEEVKKIHPKYVVLIKSGTFYEALENDAYIINNLFGYVIKDKSYYVQTGFPKVILPKVVNTLEDKKISYLILDQSDNYDELEHTDYENLNKYDFYLEKGKRESKRQEKIEKYCKYLKNNVERKFMDKLLSDIGDLIDKSREI